MKTKIIELASGRKIEVGIIKPYTPVILKENRFNYRRIEMNDCPKCEFVRSFCDKYYDWICSKNTHFTPVGDSYTCDLWIVRTEDDTKKGDKIMGDNEEDTLEFFKCYVCGQPKSVNVLKLVRFRDMTFKKDVCIDCYNTMIGKPPEKVIIKKEVI